MASTLPWISLRAPCSAAVPANGRFRSSTVGISMGERCTARDVGGVSGGFEGTVLGSSRSVTQNGGDIARGRLTGSSRRCTGTLGRGRCSSLTATGFCTGPASVSSRIMGRLAALLAGSAMGSNALSEGRMTTSSSVEYREAGEKRSAK